MKYAFVVGGLFFWLMVALALVSHPKRSVLARQPQVHCVQFLTGFSMAGHRGKAVACRDFTPNRQTPIAACRVTDVTKPGTPVYAAIAQQNDNTVSIYNLGADTLSWYCAIYGAS